MNAIISARCNAISKSNEFCQVLNFVSNPFISDNKILALPKLKAFADNNMDVAKIVHNFFDKVPAFSHFSHIVFKRFLFWGC